MKGIRVRDWKLDEQGELSKDLDCPKCGSFYKVKYAATVSSQPILCPYCGADYADALRDKVSEENKRRFGTGR